MSQERKKMQVYETQEVYDDISLQNLSDILQKYLQYDRPCWNISNCGTITLGGWRPENDGERKKRLARKKREKEKAEAKKAIEEANERATLEKLIKKYGVPDGKVSQ